jgi:hypothetical protein
MNSRNYQNNTRYILIYIYSDIYIYSAYIYIVRKKFKVSIYVHICVYICMYVYIYGSINGNKENFKSNIYII